MTRTERQKECIKKWIGSGGRAIIVCPTGFGKTYLSIQLILALKKQKENIKVIVSVPSTNLKDQWDEYRIKNGLMNNMEIWVINSLVKEKHVCDLLIIDEVHTSLSPQLIDVYSKVKFTYFLGLTATLERLDGRHEILTNWFPVVDTISIEEALKNKWLSDFKHYLVVLDVDIEPYIDANRDFYRGFEFFNRKFDVAMRCRTDYKYRMAYAKQLTTRSSEIPDANKLVMANAMLFGKGLQARKNFIANHPKKIELANKILEYRQDRKCIVFCHTIKLADKVNALVYSGKDSGKKGRVKLDDFIQAQTGAIATSKKLIAGFDCPDLSVMIDLDVNSSKIRSSQSIGRTLRYIPGKETEIFTLVLRGTVEWDWFVKSHSVDSYITIDEFNLMNILEGKEYAIKKNKEIHKMYWY